MTTFLANSAQPEAPALSGASGQTGVRNRPETRSKCRVVLLRPHRPDLLLLLRILSDSGEFIPQADRLGRGKSRKTPTRAGHEFGPIIFVLDARGRRPRA